MAEGRLTSEGKCIFCKKTFSQRGINRHMATHLTQMEKDPGSKKGKSYLVYVKADVMFLSLWVDGNTDFEELDSFLRAIWLECCGHLSAFNDPNGYYKHPKSSQQNMWMMDFDHSPQEVPLGTKAFKVFKKGKKLNYEYDFGSTTYLEIEVKGEYKIKAHDSIVLLSRNEPLKIICATCGKKTAVNICTVHMYEEYAFYCESCSKKHAKKCEDFADYASLPVVNSPRMGVCAYDGGQIDTERDGVYNGEI